MYPLFIFFIVSTLIVSVVLIVSLILILDLSGTPSTSREICTYDGPIPEPLEGEIIGCASDVVLFSYHSKFIPPCFVYFHNNLFFETTEHGIRLPVGLYNLYVRYLATKAVNGDKIIDRLVQTSIPSSNLDILVQSIVKSQTGTFTNHIATTFYLGVELESGANIIRIESALKAFLGLQMNMDRIEFLIDRVG